MRLLGKRSLLLAAVIGALRRDPAAAWGDQILITPAHRQSAGPGARLSTAPKVMTLNFSEPFVTGSEQVTLRRYGRGTVALALPQSHGATISQPMPHTLRGVFVVSWRVLSDDGHVSLGEFAFAVGSGGAVPTVSSTSARPWSQIAASWLVFLGVALALGGVMSERFVWGTAGVARAPVGIGIAGAAIGAAAQLVLLAGARRGGGFGAGLSATAIGDVVGARPGTLTLALLIALFAAALLLPLRRFRLLVVVPLVAAIGINSARGHSGTAGRIWALPADVVHLTAVALWVGALAHLVIVVARPASAARRCLPASDATRASPCRLCS